MNTKRTHALFIIGSDNLPELNLLEVLNNINQRYGGCTLHQGKGCWSLDGDKELPLYSNVQFEDAYQIEVCTTENDFDLDYLQRCFIPVKEFATWIHCEVWETTGHHFNAKELA